MTTASPDVVLVDYGMGNLRNVARAFERAGAQPRVVEDPDQVRRAARLVIPGVGAAGEAMAGLEARGMIEAIRERVLDGRPYLGICVGLQILFERSEEGLAPCLGLIPGRVVRFPDLPSLPVPHMGWNEVKLTRPHPVLREGFFYFVHCYRVSDVPAQSVLGTTDYGGLFPSAVATGSCVALQFHPEKSQRHGLEILERFCAWSP